MAVTLNEFKNVISAYIDVVNKIEPDNGKTNDELAKECLELLKEDMEEKNNEKVRGKFN